jgi:hypothetical protein
VDVFSGEAHFVSPHEIVVDGQTLHGKNFVIAAGTRAGIPPIEGIRDVQFFTNETIFDGLHQKPEPAPEIAHVGLNETEANQQKLSFGGGFARRYDSKSRVLRMTCLSAAPEPANSV